MHDSPIVNASPETRVKATGDQSQIARRYAALILASFALAISIWNTVSIRSIDKNLGRNNAVNTEQEIDSNFLAERLREIESPGETLAFPRMSLRMPLDDPTVTRILTNVGFVPIRCIGRTVSGDGTDVKLEVFNPYFVRLRGYSIGAMWLPGDDQSHHTTSSVFIVRNWMTRSKTTKQADKTLTFTPGTWQEIVVHLDHTKPEEAGFLELMLTFNSMGQ